MGLELDLEIQSYHHIKLVIRESQAPTFSSSLEVNPEIIKQLSGVCWLAKQEGDNIEGPYLELSGVPAASVRTMDHSWSSLIRPSSLHTAW